MVIIINRFSETPKDLLHVIKWPHEGKSKPPLRDAEETYTLLTDLISQLKQHGYKTTAREKLTNLGLLPELVSFLNVPFIVIIINKFIVTIVEVTMV